MGAGIPGCPPPSIRVTLVLGAGSSLASGLTVWDRKFKGDLIATAAEAFRDKQTTFITECWNKLSGTVGLPDGNADRRRQQLIERASIEQIASVALQYDVIADSIYKMLDEKFTPADVDSEGFQPPQLAYEFIAHFMKHAFVDHVMTFNFDELLDEAVRNELGAGEFVRIASEADIARGAPPPLPHLIKLHGTLSRPPTLRFTPDTTSALPAAMVGLLDRLILGVQPDGAKETRPPKHKATRPKAYILSLGYGWHDPDVLHWLNARRDRVAGLIILSKHDDCDRLQQTFGTSRGGWRKGQVRVLDVDRFFRVQPQLLTVDAFLWALWNELEAAMEKLKIPFMPASRHLLLSYLFGPNDGDSRDRLNRHGALRRLIVEFMLHLAKCKGMVNLSTLVSTERIGRYYARVKHDHSKLAQDCGQDLVSLVTAVGFVQNHLTKGWKGPDAESVTVQQSLYADVKETYYATATKIEDLAAPLSTRAFTTKPQPMPTYSPRERRIIEARGRELEGARFIAEHIDRIFRGPEIEVARRTPDRETWTLRAAKPLATYIDLQQETRNVLDTDWNELFVVAESGEWLTKDVMQAVIAKKARRIFLVVARQPSENEWPLRRIQIDADLTSAWAHYKTRGVEIYQMPLSWWQHNRHLTLAFRRRPATVTCTGGVYFRRRHKNSRIQPLLVDAGDREDVAELALTFLSYTRRAYTECRQDGVEPPDAEQFVLGACDVAKLLKCPDHVASRLTKVANELEVLYKTRASE